MFLLKAVFEVLNRKTYSKVTVKKKEKYTYKDIVPMTFFFSAAKFLCRKKWVIVLFVGKAHVQNERKVSFPVNSE